ncbi:hypothetical protein ACN26Z_09330 [Verrucosispora sp. WMMD703]
MKQSKGRKVVGGGPAGHAAGQQHSPGGRGGFDHDSYQRIQQDGRLRADA